MAAPTLTSESGSTWTDVSSGNETTGTLTWGSGDRILIIGMTEDAGLTIGTPTGGSLTFTALGSPLAVTSSCWAHAWTATAASPSSGALTGPLLAGGIGTRGIHAMAFGGCTGFVRTDGPTQDSTKTVAVTRTQANSFVVAGLADWSASGITGLGWTPTGQTQLQAVAPTAATFLLAYWGDQGSAGSGSYGVTGVSGTKYTRLAVEVLGTVGSTPPVGPPTLISQAVNRSYTY